MWDKTQFEKVAKDIAEEFVSDTCAESINDLSVKVAASNNLNPEQIRTMVRLANVATFQTIFNKDAADKMVEFDPGDAEVVIHKLYKEASSKHGGVEKTAAYDKSTDYYTDVAELSPPMEKEALQSEEAPTAGEFERVNPRELELKIKKATDEIKLYRYGAEVNWRSVMEKAAHVYRLTYGPEAGEELPGFEKEAVALLGDDIDFELKILGGLVGGTPNREIIKTASIPNYVVVSSGTTRKITELLKEARQYRYNFSEHQASETKLLEYEKEARKYF